MQRRLAAPVRVKLALVSHGFDPSRFVGTASLPADYLQLTARRLGGAAIAALAFGLYGALYRTLWVAQPNLVGQAAGALGLIVSSLVAAYVLLGARETAAAARARLRREREGVARAADRGVTRAAPLVAALLAWAPTSALDRIRADVQRARRLGSYALTERLGAGGDG